MHVTMVKKRLRSGEPCRKCAQAEDLLKTRGLWDRVDEVVWADEKDPYVAPYPCWEAWNLIVHKIQPTQ